MKRLILLLILVPALSLSAQTAKIKIDIDRTIGEIYPKIYVVLHVSTAFITQIKIPVRRG